MRRYSGAQGSCGHGRRRTERSRHSVWWPKSSLPAGAVSSTTSGRNTWPLSSTIASIEPSPTSSGSIRAFASEIDSYTRTPPPRSTT